MSVFFAALLEVASTDRAAKIKLIEVLLVRRGSSCGGYRLK